VSVQFAGIHQIDGVLDVAVLIDACPDDRDLIEHHREQVDPVESRVISTDNDSGAPGSQPAEQFAGYRGVAGCVEDDVSSVTKIIWALHDPEPEAGGVFAAGGGGLRHGDGRSTGRREQPD
jgi:hypothetical protein